MKKEERSEEKLSFIQCQEEQEIFLEIDGEKIVLPTGKKITVSSCINLIINGNVENLECEGNVTVLGTVKYLEI